MCDISLRIYSENVVRPSDSTESLEGAVGYIGIITHVLGYDKTTMDSPLPAPVPPSYTKANLFRVQVNCATLGSVAQMYLKGDFSALMQSYSVKRPENLVGKPVIAVCKKDADKQLIGLLSLPHE